MVNTGMRAARAVAIAEPSADNMVLSPPTNRACAPREASARTASTTADEFSTLASTRVSPVRLHTSRAASVNASEFDSAGFQATPTVCSAGSAWRASSKASPTGRKEPWPTRWRGWFSGFARSSPMPAAEGVRDEPEDVLRAAVPVRVGDGLHRWRARRQDQIELAGRDLSRDGIARGEIALRVVGLDPQPLAVTEAGPREALDHALDAFIEHRRRGVLDDGDAEDASRRRMGRPTIAIGHEEHSRREDDQREAKREALDGVPHLHGGSTSGMGP